MSSNINFVNDASNGGFLSGFVEASVEKPADGLNGECTVHYSGQYSKYEMIVSLVNGVRESEAIILNDGIPFLNLKYERGLLTGAVEKMNDHGIVVLRGHLVNGVESGLFLEYEGTGKEYAKGGKTVEYFGDWKNGKRNGIGTEYRGLRVLYIGEWKDGKRNGMGYERDGNGVMKRGCLFENGEMKRVVQEFDEGKMIEYDENGRKVYEGEYKGSVEKGFVREGFGKEYRMVEEKITSRAKPTIEIEKKRFCCWVREIEHEDEEVEMVTKKC